MHSITWLFSLASLPQLLVSAAPLIYNITDPASGPMPGQSSIYTNTTTISPPWPGNVTGAILNTTSGPPGPDDLLFQNLLSAEWIVFSFYQQAVEAFNESSFAQFPNTTYDRIVEIRNNEAGHLRIFQDAISSNSIKPGPCKYFFPFENAVEMLALQTFIEISSLAFLTGLVQQSEIDANKGALIAIAATESRHNTWALIDIWNTDPFAGMFHYSNSLGIANSISGPSDTVFPYANQILDLTNSFIIPGSCPAENPGYPSPRQNLPPFAAAVGTESIAPGATIEFNFTKPANQPMFKPDHQYHAVFFHGVHNISAPFDTQSNTTTIPAEFEDLGLILAVISKDEGATTKEMVVAGPAVLLEQPSAVSLELASL